MASMSHTRAITLAAMTLAAILIAPALAQSVPDAGVNGAATARRVAEVATQLPPVPPRLHQ